MTCVKSDAGGFSTCGLWTPMGPLHKNVGPAGPLSIIATTYGYKPIYYRLYLDAFGGSSLRQQCVVSQPVARGQRQVQQQTRIRPALRGILKVNSKTKLYQLVRADLHATNMPKVPNRRCWISGWCSAGRLQTHIQIVSMASRSSDTVRGC